MFAAALVLAAAFARSATAQWSSHMDIGSVMRHELPAERASFPARLNAAATHESTLGALWLSGQALGGFARSSRSDVVATAAFESREISWLGGFRAHLEGTSAGTRLAEGVRRDRTEIGIGTAVERWGTGGRVVVRRATFVGAPTPAATTVDLQLATGLARVLVTVGGRRVRYPDSFVIQVDTVYRLAQFEYRGIVDRLTNARRAYVEGDGGLQLALGRVALQAQGGVRFRADGVRGEHWGLASVEVPLLDRIAVVGELGHRMSAPEQRLPAYRFGSISLRLRGSTGNRHSSMPNSRPDDEPRVEVVWSAPAAQSIVVRGVSARSVEIKGDFTNWQPAPLQALSPRVWRYESVIPGMHRFLLRVDGGPWHVPPGLPTVADELGEAGLLVVQP